ncbi:hypothetical protein [Rudanella lutea]|uniref:hypothetical protein n=1 Tax=Rudanella lutea TaxID=451374 RepID=UPI0003683424|nr:hypothetical protein [Rudanella lutea]
MQHDNKHGQKISVKHYLNTNLKPKLSVQTNEDGYEEIHLYPIYVRIKVKGQLTRLKSKLTEYYSEDVFAHIQGENPLPHYSPLIQDIENEEYIIIQQILKQKPFDNPNFNLNTAVHWNFHYWPPYLLDTAVNSYLRSRVNNVFQEVATEVYHNDQEWINIDEIIHQVWVHDPESEDEGDLVETALLHFGEILPESPRTVAAMVFLYSHFIKEVRDLRNEYPPSFWQLQYYIDIMRNESGQYDPKYIPPIVRRELFTIREWVTGSFEDQFMRVIGDSRALEGIKIGINKMLMNDSEIAMAFKDAEER